MDTIMNNLIDLHNHSLPSVDDGAKTLEESVNNIKYLKKLGFKKVLLTSHYIVNSEFTANVQKRTEILEKLQEELNDDEIKLYIGNEVFINNGKVLINLLKQGEITTLNNSRYLLVEFPLNQKFRYIEDVIYELNEAGYIPIIAHPERYAYIKNDYNRIYEFLDFDCRLQCNLTSLVGYYGSHAKKIAKKLLKLGLVSFVATDFHHIKEEDLYKKSLKKLKRIVGENEFNNLLCKNPEKVLNNEIVEMPAVKYRTIK